MFFFVFCFFKIDSLKSFLGVFKVCKFLVSSVSGHGRKPQVCRGSGHDSFTVYIHSSDCIGEQNGISAGHS